MTGYTQAVKKLMEPDVLQLLEGLTGTESFEEMAQNSNSPENKLLAIASAMAAYKNLTARLVGELGTLLAMVDKKLGMQHTQHTLQPAHFFDEEAEEMKQDDRTRITRLIQQLNLKRVELNVYIEQGKEQYQNCQQLLRHSVVRQISTVLDKELGSLGDNPAVADAIYALYETRQENKASIINKLTTFGPQMPRSDISQEALNKKMDQNFDTGTQVQLVGFLRDTAQDAALTIELKSYLEAANRIDQLVNLYAKIMLAVSNDYQVFLKKAESAAPQATKALSQLQQALEVTRMNPHFNAQGRTGEDEEEQAENRQPQVRNW